MAVGAHIRHSYTNYDKLLKQGYTWQEARQGVEQFTLDKLVAWRGDEDENPFMEEVLREVVVIPDESGDSPLAETTASSALSQNERLLRDEQTEMMAIDLTISDDDDDDSDESDADDIAYHTYKDARHAQGPAESDARRSREARDIERRRDLWKQALQRRRTRLAAEGQEGKVDSQSRSGDVYFEAPMMVKDHKSPRKAMFPSNQNVSRPMTAHTVFVGLMFGCT